MLVPMPRRGFPRVQRFVPFLGSHSDSTEADPCLFRRERGDDFLEPRIIPKPIEHRIEHGIGPKMASRPRLIAAGARSAYMASAPSSLGDSAASPPPRKPNPR